MQTTRRAFLSGAILAASATPKPLGLPIGCQLYPVRDAIAKDLPGTLRELSAAGYEMVEMCSPHGYERSGFGSLLKMTASELRKTIQTAGLGCESSHYQFRELKEHMEERIAYAKELGLKQMIVASLGLKPDAAMADWTRAAEEMNRLGERAAKAGLQLGFHNHNTEFREIDGVLIYDQILKVCDPKLVKMQFQPLTIMLGIDPVPFVEKNPGRFLSLHLQDWSVTEKQMKALGRGSIDWKKLFGAARRGGVKNYFVEMEMELMKASVPFLRGLA